MARRLDKTLVDYLVIAISPALIMTLIGSLIWFLLEVFYRGQFSGRLHWILSLFIMGAVLVGRISIEEGRERAALFAGPLAIVTLLAINRFVELRGVPLAFVINCGLIGLIWWCAHRLTWDCTLIDEGEPDSGEGLLEAVGLDRPEKPKPESSPLALAAGTTEWSGPGATANEPDGTTSPPDAPPATWHQRLARWWDAFVERRRRPHAPGLWVVYFSLAALPLFGLGQLFIRSTDLESRRYVFHLMLVYVGSGLGLLLTTSFLGLRRYLRQRRLEMPLAMVNVWLGMGVALIATVMALALLVPRPNAEYAISRFAPAIDSPERTSSRYGMGKEGVEEDKPWSRAHKLDEKGKLPSDKPGDTGPSPSDEKGDQGGAASEPQDKQPTRKAASAASEKGESQGEAAKPQPDNGEAAGQSPSEKGDQKTRSQGEKTRSQGEHADAQAKKDAQPGGRDGQQPAQKAESPAKPADPRRGGKPSGQSRSREAPRQEEAKGPPAAKPPAAPRPPQPPLQPPSPPPAPMPGIAWLLALLKWVFYAAIVGLAAWWVWRNWQTVLAALRDLRQAWRDFWQNLFAKKSKKAAAPAEQSVPATAQPRPFADFPDPFARGIAGRYAPEELVRYSFLALEAWAREHDCAREPEDTPHEFAAKIGLAAPVLAQDALHLADLYCQAAYAPDALSIASVEPLRRLWRNFPRTTAAVQAVQ